MSLRYFIVITAGLSDGFSIITLTCHFIFLVDQKLPNPPFSRLLKEVSRRDDIIKTHLEELKVATQKE